MVYPHDDPLVVTMKIAMNWVEDSNEVGSSDISPHRELIRYTLSRGFRENVPRRCDDKGSSHKCSDSRGRW